MDSEKRLNTYMRQRNVPAWSYSWEVISRLTPRQKRRYFRKRYSGKPPF